MKSQSNQWCDDISRRAASLLGPTYVRQTGPPAAASEKTKTLTSVVFGIGPVGSDDIYTIITYRTEEGAVLAHDDEMIGGTRNETATWCC